jgi:hypothetical protein
MRLAPCSIAKAADIRAVVYYLDFASQKDVVNDIVEEIFSKYRNRRA